MDVKTLRVLNDYPKGSLWSDRTLLLDLSVERGECALIRSRSEILSLSEGCFEAEEPVFHRGICEVVNGRPVFFWRAFSGRWDFLVGFYRAGMKLASVPIMVSAAFGGILPRFVFGSSFDRRRDFPKIVVFGDGCGNSLERGEHSGMGAGYGNMNYDANL